LAFSGVTGKNITSISKPLPIKQVIKPEKNYTEFYAQKFQTWQSLYQETKQFNQIKNDPYVT